MAIMHQMGFPPKWCTWIYGLLSSARAAVLVNGTPTFEFQCGKGMRQGDPISPFLFLIVMEGFSCMINKATASGFLAGLKLPKGGPVISHLLYADDCTFIGDWSMCNLYKVARALRVFYLCSGLRINLGKSNLFGVGVDNTEVKRAAEVFKCKEGSLPFKYLGLRIGGNMNRISSWDFLFDIFESRLANWKAKSLSIGGRVTPIKAVLESLPSFLWGGSHDEKKIHWVAWDRVASPIKHGGLGLCRLADSNIALLSKWIWRYRNEDNALWKKVIDSLHGNCEGWRSVPVNKSLASGWKNIVQKAEKVKVAGKDLIGLFKGICGKGDRIRFWIDPWVDNTCLKELFPLLFGLENDKKCLVADRFCTETKRFVGNSIWYSMPISQEVLEEWLKFTTLLEGIRLTDVRDK
uniref:uncharacterized protein LOC122596934 n=1 Tax=Erigeron canadensis TaxID=72917 RepID=UPI001CB948A8|nr:uncharacterized protein LOC122596934 [Erigeron canadensis]